MTDVKLCRDCRWFRGLQLVGQGIVWPQCTHESVTILDVVQGGRWPVDCSKARDADGKCGPEAGLWEQKPPAPPVPVAWWKFWRRA